MVNIVILLKIPCTSPLLHAHSVDQAIFQPNSGPSCILEGTDLRPTARGDLDCVEELVNDDEPAGGDPRCTCSRALSRSPLARPRAISRRSAYAMQQIPSTRMRSLSVGDDGRVLLGKDGRPLLRSGNIGYETLAGLQVLHPDAPVLPEDTQEPDAVHLFAEGHALEIGLVGHG